MGFPTTAGSLAAWTDQNANIPGTGTPVNATSVNAIITEINALTNTLGASALALSNLAEDPATTTALIWGWQAGRVVEDNVISTVAAGTIALTNNATNYIEYSASTATMYTNVSAFTTGRKPIAKVVTSGGFITGTVASRDQRTWLNVFSGTAMAAGGNYTITGTWTWGNHLLFTDNTYDIGASGATRPRTGYFGTSVYSPIFATGADPADQGAIRLSNAEVIAWEDATECTLTHVDNTGLSLNLALTVGTGLTVTAGGATITAGNLGVGTATSSDKIITMSANNLAATSVYGTVLNFTAGTNNTGDIFGSYMRLYSSGTFTSTSAKGIYIESPAWTSGLTLGASYGIHIANMGKASATALTHAYGIYIDAPTGAATTNIGLYNAGTTQLAIGVGIGTAPAASQLLDVRGTTTTADTQLGFYLAPTFNASATSLGAGINIHPTFTGSPSVGYGILIDTADGAGTPTTLYGIYIGAQTKGSTNIGLYNAGTTTLVGAVTAQAGMAISGAKAAEYTNTMFIDNLSGAARFYAYGPNGSTGGTVEFWSAASDGDPMTPVMVISAAGVVTINQLASGNLTSASGVITSSSDARLKTIGSNFTRGLDSILGLTPVYYHWNEKSGIPTGPEYAGFIAQDVMRFIPEAVSVGPDGMMGLSDRPIIASLVNSVKQLNSRIESLKAEVKSLREKQ